jgi:hypothetical protein
LSYGVTTDHFYLQIEQFPPSPRLSFRGYDDVLDRNEPPAKPPGHWQLMLKKWLKDRYGTTENLTWKVIQMQNDWMVIAYCTRFSNFFVLQAYIFPLSIRQEN